MSYCEKYYICPRNKKEQCINSALHTIFTTFTLAE
jgi:hypothetical protein